MPSERHAPKNVNSGDNADVTTFNALQNTSLRRRYLHSVGMLLLLCSLGFLSERRDRLQMFLSDQQFDHHPRQQQQSAASLLTLQEGQVSSSSSSSSSLPLTWNETTKTGNQFELFKSAAESTVTVETVTDYNTDQNLKTMTMTVTTSNGNVVGWSEELFQMIVAYNRSNDTSGLRVDLSSSFFPIIKVEEEFAYIRHDDGVLVVDVTEEYMFWNGGQKKLCQLLKNMTLKNGKSLDDDDDIDSSKRLLPKALVNITMDCRDHYKNKQGLGQGNWITAIYASRMAAALAGVDFKFQCSDGRDSMMELLLPWFDQYVSAPPRRNSTNKATVWPYGGSRPTEWESCPSKYPFLRIDKMASQIQNDLQRMAIALVGPRDETRRHPEVPPTADPLIPDIDQLDEVALHFRCGDVLGGAKRNDFGMIRFKEYEKWIDNTTTSIGILTQPFEKEKNRGQDQRKADNCRIVVSALVDYLKKVAPLATITIRNGANDTHPLTYARLVMAKTSITSLSSFGIFPVLGTFGRGIFQRGNRGVNPWANHVPEYLQNIHMMEAEVRGTGEMYGKSIDDLLAWFLEE